MTTSHIAAIAVIVAPLLVLNAVVRAIKNIDDRAYASDVIALCRNIPLHDTQPPRVPNEYVDLSCGFYYSMLIGGTVRVSLLRGTKADRLGESEAIPPSVRADVTRALREYQAEQRIAVLRIVFVTWRPPEPGTYLSQVIEERETHFIFIN